MIEGVLGMWMAPCGVFSPMKERASEHTRIAVHRLIFCYKNQFYMANGKMPCLKFPIEMLPPHLVGNP